MSTASQIPRNSIIWLLLAQFVVIAPHSLRMSWWMIALWLLCALWRIAMHRGSASYPAAWLRTLLVVMGSGGVVISFGESSVLDLAVALLILAFSMKLIEVRQRRDLYLVFYLAYFIVAASFLFSQSLFLALYHIVSIVLITAAMVATQRALTGGSALESIRKACILFTQAIPIMLLFFLVFPRIAPLWKIPNGESIASTGMSANISPGDIAKLVQSDEEVFRATFKTAVISRELLYWRGMTLSHFDGRAWTKNTTDVPVYKKNNEQGNSHYELLGTAIDYSVNVKASGQHWLFLLPMANVVKSPSNTNFNIETLIDYNLQTDKKITKQHVFQVKSFLNFHAETTLSPERLTNELLLPNGYNPKTREWAKNLRSSSLNNQHVVRQLLNIFTEQNFSYTLEPPKLGRHSVDDFLFTTQSGFCEHYANAFVFTLRAAGIPSRVVIGYQGGSINFGSREVLVRQKDAHAWAEYWIQGEGWRRVDPTAAVSPDRIKLGSDESINTELNSNSLALFASQFGLGETFAFQLLQQKLEQLDTQWKIWVVGFDNESQLLVLENLLGEVSPLRAGLFVVATLGLVLASIAAIYLVRRESTGDSPEKVLYLLFCKKVEVLGLYRQLSEPPRNFAARVNHVFPAYAHQVNAITQRFETIAYQEICSSVVHRDLQQRVKVFNPAKP